MLRDWDYRWASTSVPTSLAVFWGEALWRRREAAECGRAACRSTTTSAAAPAPEQQLAGARRRRRPARPPTSAAGRRRGARSTASSASPATSCSRSTTRGPSIPVPFTSARWGSLASFGARPCAGHEKLVRHERQQLRRGGRVRRARARARGHRRRRERRPRVAALQRPGRALRHRQPARRLLLPRRNRRAPPKSYHPGD